LNSYADSISQSSNPNEVSFTTAQAWKDIYGHGHKQLPKYIFSREPNRAPSIINADDADHTRYRKSLSHAFSDKALRSQEDLIKKYIDMLVQKLQLVASSSEKTDMLRWYNLTTFDLIGDLAFGESFNGLESTRVHGWIAMLFSSIKIFPFIRTVKVYPFLGRLLPMIVPKRLMEDQAKHRAYTKSVVMKRVNNTEQHGRGDFMDSMMKHRGEKDGLTDQELETNAEILVVAGSETTATLLSGATYWLLRTPDAMKKVTSEVRQAFQSEDEINFVSATARLPYMLACLDEALRLYPPAPSGQQRITLEPTDISGVQVPAKTIVSVHQSAAYRSPHNFYQPMSYAPERWLPNPPAQFANDDKSAVQPFSVGPRNCIGRNLAYNEMRLILARVLWNFDLELCDESREWYQQKTYILWEKPPLMCRLKQRVF
jgi:cytochrome P450